tara:strand:+ start:52 stop:228 length:177 start_codon:yes stop_codon:yes gene_type:complete
MKKALLRMRLEDIYLKYVNDWLTIAAMAEHYDVSEKQLSNLYNTAKEIREKHFSDLLT